MRISLIRISLIRISLSLVRISLVSPLNRDGDNETQQVNFACSFYI